MDREPEISVLMTSTSFPRDRDDWRATFIRNLVDAVSRREEIDLRLWSPPGECSERVRRVSSESENGMLKTLMEAGGIAHTLRQNRLTGLLFATKLMRGLRRVYRSCRPHIYHVNWLQSAIPLPHNGVPAAVTALGSDMQFLSIPGVAPLLRRSFRGRRVVLCPNADWMVAPLREKFQGVAEVRAVPFGIDPEWYSVSRAEISGTAPNWLVISRLTEAKIGPLFEWCAPLFSGTGRRLHLIGPMQETMRVPDWAIYHGSVSPGEISRRWFPGAAGLISLSRHAEGRPQVMLEAMAAGVPIIASPMPAHESLVEQGRTGFIVDSSEALGKAISELESPERNRDFGSAARESVRHAIGTWDDCAERFCAIYKELLKTSRP